MENIKQLDNTQLLDLIKENETEANHSHILDDDISNFLSFYNIIPGNEKVAKRTLFKLYKNWSTSLQPFKLQGFTLHLNKKQFTIENNKVLINQNEMNIDTLILKKLDEKYKIPRDKSIRYRQRLEQFLKDCEVKSGDYWIRSNRIYQLQKRYFTNKACFDSHVLIKLLKLYIKEHDYVNGNQYFRVDKSIKKHLESSNEKKPTKKPKKKC